MRYWAAWALINSKRQILLLKRSDYSDNFPHYWGLPWWRGDEWESAEEIVIREVMEETHLKFTPTELIETWVMWHWDKVIKKHRFIWTYSWNIKICEDEDEWYWWYSYEETRDLKIAFDFSGTIEILHDKWLI